jgi:hypothetical protein
VGCVARGVIMAAASGSGATDEGMVEAGAEDGATDTGQPACLDGGGCTLLRREVTTVRGKQTAARLIPRKTSWLYSRKRPPG